jgi:hypothetical protein
MQPVAIPSRSSTGIQSPTSQLIFRKAVANISNQMSRLLPTSNNQLPLWNITQNLPRLEKAAIYATSEQQSLSFSMITCAGYFIMSERRKKIPHRDLYNSGVCVKEVSHITMSFIPHRRSEFTAKVTLDHYLEQTWLGTVCHPVLSFEIIQPYCSGVFDIVHGGTVQELREWIASNTRTVKVCDRYGRSLLNVRCTFPQEIMEIKLLRL